MIFRQLFDAKSSTYTYLLADAKSREAVLIDTVYEQFQRDAALLRELGLTLTATLETHVHADHVTAAWLFKQRVGSQIVCGKATGASGADRYVGEEDAIRFGPYTLEVRATPGHTDGCVSYVTSDKTMAFTGDALMIRAAGRTDFQEGDPKRLYHSVHEQLFTLPAACMIYPGHDYQGRTASSIGEEKAFNPRLGGDRSEEDFVGYMNNLGLAHPNQIEIAVPANLRCGKPDKEAPAEHPWAPAVRTFAGVWEVDPSWVNEHLKDLFVLDVREPSEFTGELGHIPGAHLISIGGLRAKMDALPHDQPIVAVCRSGGRSAQASLMLEAAGRTRVANVAGGMIRWRALGLPIAKA